MVGEIAPPPHPAWVEDEALAELALRVRTRRLELGLTQERVAETAGLHYTYVSRIEGGIGNVSVGKLLPLARSLKTTASALLEGL